MKAVIALALCFLFAALCCLLLPFLVAAIFGWSLEVATEEEFQEEERIR